MRDRAEVQCPYCGEWLELVLDPQSQGEMVHDCEVCCRPWSLRVRFDAEGEPVVSAHRLD